MGLMLEALKQIEGGVSLPSIARFSFPAVPEPPECASPAEASALVWPECHDARTASACAQSAERMLRQLSAEADSPVGSLARPMVVALTSPGDGDGKTSLLLALAPQLAQRIAGRMLVVDANIRKPDLTMRLGLPEARRGGAVCAAILGSPQPEAAQPPVIYPTNLPRLNVLPAARGTDQNVRPTATPAAWIDELREDWPLVVLDASSLAYAETAPLARCCDGAYLVVRLGHTARRAVAEAARALRAKGGRLLGCLVIK